MWYLLLFIAKCLEQRKVILPLGTINEFDSLETASRFFIIYRENLIPFLDYF